MHISPLLCCCVKNKHEFNLQPQYRCTLLDWVNLLLTIQSFGRQTITINIQCRHTNLPQTDWQLFKAWQNQKNQNKKQQKNLSTSWWKHNLNAVEFATFEHKGKPWKIRHAVANCLYKNFGNYQKTIKKKAKTIKNLAFSGKLTIRKCGNRQFGALVLISHEIGVRFEWVYHGHMMKITLQ